MDRQNLLISVSGIRGVVGKLGGLTPETALRFAAAYATYCKKGRVFVGSDTRPSRTVILPAVIAGLTGCGLDVIDLGICPTPTVELAVKTLKAAGGLIITASHNPIEWNALKMLNSQGMFLSPAEGERLLRIYHSGVFAYKPHNALGKVGSMEFVAAHIDKILKLPAVKINAIKKRRFKVALDAVNGAGAMLSPKLLHKLGCEVICVNCQPTGIFARGPEPVPGSLRQLSRAVKSNKCDLGFALDPDADRLAIVDEFGKPIGEEYTLAFAIDYILSIKKGPVAVNLSTSRMAEDIAARYGVRVHRTKVGEIHSSLELKTARGVIGGEGNGGVIYPEFLYGRDAAVGMALVLSYLAKRGVSVSQAVDALPRFVMIKDKIEATHEEIEGYFPELTRFSSGAVVNIDDGIKFDYEDSWMHIRASNTEPFARIIAEARTAKEAKKLVLSARAVIKGGL